MVEMGAPKVSVIVPVYKTADVLPRCLDSILAQTMGDLEVIVVDDGSPDDAAEVAQVYAAEDPRVRLIRQENQGVGTARNRGVQEARGSYLSFIDSDDLIEPTMFQLMLDAAEATGAPVVNCEAFLDVCRPSGEAIRTSILRLPFDSDYVSGAEASAGFLALVPPVLTSMGFKLVRRSAFSERMLAFPVEDRFGEDMVVAAAVILASPAVALVRQPLYHYVHSDSLRTTSFSLKKARDLLADMDQIAGYAEEAARITNLDAFRSEMLFSVTRQITWSEAYRTPEAQELLDKVRDLRPPAKPVVEGVGIPLMQRIKMDSVRGGWAVAACRTAYRLRFLPAIQHMM